MVPACRFQTIHRRLKAYPEEATSSRPEDAWHRLPRVPQASKQTNCCTSTGTFAWLTLCATKLFSNLHELCQRTRFHSTYIEGRACPPAGNTFFQKKVPSTTHLAMSREWWGRDGFQQWQFWGTGSEGYNVELWGCHLRAFAQRILRFMASNGSLYSSFWHLSSLELHRKDPYRHRIFVGRAPIFGGTLSDRPLSL